MFEPEFKKLVEYKRNGLVEQEHSGLVLHMNQNEILSMVGNDNGYRFYHRSCMKPFQLSALIDEDVDKKYNFSLEEIAVSTASHTGSLEHQRVIRNILNKIGLDESYLLCPAHKPLSVEEQKRLIREGKEPSAIHNNCSGKHAAMLALCKAKGWALNNYMDETHPLYDFVIKKVLKLCEVNDDEYSLSKDGCGLPAVGTTLFQLGKGFLNLFLDEKYLTIAEAFSKNPYLIGGKDRLDTDIITATNGRLIAKVGAGGLCVVVNREKREALVVKIADANMPARAIIVIEALRIIKWLEETEISTSCINKQFDRDIKTLLGESVGLAELCFTL